MTNASNYMLALRLQMSVIILKNRKKLFLQIFIGRRRRSVLTVCSRFRWSRCLWTGTWRRYARRVKTTRCSWITTARGRKLRTRLKSARKSVRLFIIHRVVKNTWSLTIWAKKSRIWQFLKNLKYITI